ncbi:glycoside hydrolase family 15 protein [Mucisphaera calidilacus]|uniref:Glucoamylase n=1 Tax=Mucisphaera calidilacus TaxID=2527982 RepID=A0A518BWD0_9BACT|nr:glycoside hydrolase family 15 protein [Mucisphaera calidilacus]QDU71278.1 Glucoamylase precursor [Mucisphaera calidilacus]
MPRDIPVGNGQLLVTFDQHYRIRDLYYPHVGQENHGSGGACGFGVWSDIVPATKAERRRKRLFWSDQGWTIRQGYQEDTLTTDVVMTHPELRLELRCSDVVDFHRPVLVRRIEVHNQTSKPREVRLLHHQDLFLYGTRVGDTAYFDPQVQSIIHYRMQRYVLASFYASGEPAIHEYATGTAGFGGAEGTWRDAEDGHLGNNPIAQGAVDSTIMTRVQLEPNGKQVVHLVIGFGQSYDDVEDLHHFVHRESPQGIIDRTTAYWRLWLNANRVPLCDRDETCLGPEVSELYKRSLLVVRSQIDNGGAIIAANDSDIMQFSRDTYSYLWPRDGAFVADSLDAAGYPDVARSFFSLCARIINHRGYFLHKYGPDGAAASSWHPWTQNGLPQVPIQEDETALVIWALWRHFVRYRDIEFVRPLWMRLIQPAANFMARFRDPATGLPLPSYDLWEERYGVHTFTVASVYAGLKSAEYFARAFGDQRLAETYSQSSYEIREAFCRHLWSQEHGRFLRRIEPVDSERTARLMGEILAGRTPMPEGQEHLGLLDRVALPKEPREDIEYYRDEVIDSSMYAVFALGLLPVEDERVRKTMEAIEDQLWVKTEVGGVARYRNDYYHQVSQDVDRIPGNPWFICTLWLADYYIARARSVDELSEAARFIRWTADRALPSRILAEQVHPESNDPLSVSPLTWSHATFVGTVASYLTKLERLRAGVAEPSEGIDEPARMRQRVVSAIPTLTS